MALSAGDLVFLGYDSDNNDVVLLTTATISAGEVIYFTDDEWNGTSFDNANEQLIEWTVPAELAPGTILTLDMIRGPAGQDPRGSADIYEGTEPGDPADALGGIDYLRGGGAIGGQNEQLWILQGDVDPVTGEITPTPSPENPTGFISVISNEAEADPGGPDLENTGLSSDNGAVIIDGDEDFMIFDPVLALGDKTFVEAPEVVRETILELVGNPDNWTTADGGGNQNPGAGFDFNVGNLGGLPTPISAEDDVTTLFFTGDKVAFVDSIDDPDGSVSEFETQITFEPTDLFEIDIVSSDIQTGALEGEFDFDQVIFTRVAVTRGGVTYEFDVDAGSKVKETGGPNSGTKEQGDSFFTTNDDVEIPGGTPFPTFSGTMAFSLDEAFIDSDGNPVDTVIMRSRPDLDTNGDGDTDGGTPFNNENFNVGTVLIPPPIPCFVAGTLVDTPSGPRAVETLRAGDLVMTRDHGAQKLLWVGRASAPTSSELAPILIRSGVLENTSDIRVSPQHRLLISNKRVEMHFGFKECLVAARHLCDGTRILEDRSAPRVEYVHLMFADHELVCTSGLWSESYFPGSYGLALGASPLDRELRRLFPDRFGAPISAKSARPCLKSYEARLVSE